jgi:peptidoglycan/LPS O-acetylase OafA/YrhL
MKYRKEIDGLRAIAVLPVILFHAGFTTFSGGFVGVDIFFVISGYLITTIIVDEMDKGSFSLLNFYERRARRILPALFFVMLCTLLFAWFLLPPDDMRSFAKSLVAVPLFISNLLFYRESGYFDTLTDLKPLLHTWSLAVEEQYYLLFPLFLIVAWKFGKRSIIAILIIVSTISIVLAQWASSTHPNFAFYMLPTRGFELLIGAIISLFLNYKPRIISVSQSLSLLGIALVTYSIFAFDRHTPFPSFYTLIPTIGTGLILIFANQNNIAGKLLGHKLLVRIGLISYSAYLWHQPIFSLSKQVIPIEASTYLVLFLVGMSLALGYFNWKYLEKPFRNKNKVGLKKLIVIVAIFSIIFFIFGIKGYLSNGYPNRQGMEIYKDFDNDIEKIGYKKCTSSELTDGEKINYCYEASNGPVNAVIIGDSHAADKFYGIEKNITEHNWALIGNSSCPPVMKIDVEGDQKNCRIKFEKIFNHIINNNEIQTVVLSYFGNYPLTTAYAADHIANKVGPDSVKISSTKSTTNDRSEIFYFGLSETVRTLLASNKKVYLLVDVPELPYFPINCVKGFSNCSVTKSEALMRQEQHRAIVARLEKTFPKLIVYDPINLFCDDSQCTYKNGKNILYKDSHHLTFIGSDLYGKRLKEVISNQ